MVQIINDENQSIAGSLGRSFGRGLGDQLPKGIERGMLSQGLKNLGQQDFSQKKPLEILGHLSSIPGMTPELTNLAYQQIANQRALANPYPEVDEGNAKPTNVNIEKVITPSGLGQSATKSNYHSLQDIDLANSKILNQPTPEQNDALARVILQRNPSLSWDQALDRATTQNNGKFTAQSNALNTYDTTAQQRVSQSLQSKGFGDFSKVPGEIQQAIVDRNRVDVINGNKTPAQAAEAARKTSLDIAKSADKMAASGSVWKNLFRPGIKNVTDLKAQGKNFIDNGFVEQAIDTATSSYDMTPMQAAHVFEPVKNKSISKEIESINKFKTPKINFLGSADKEWDKINEKYKESIDRIIQSITPEDNLNSIQYQLRDKGLDVAQFRDRVQDMVDEGRIELTERQQRQQERPADNSYWGDIMFQRNKGKGK